MIKLLVSSCIFLTWTCHSQDYIVPFENYATCNVGFQTIFARTIIWPAQFEQVFEVVDREAQYDWESTHYWIVKKEGRFGMLSPTGEVVIPFLYEEIKLIHSSIGVIVHQNGKAAIFSMKGDTLVPFDFDDIQVMDSKFHQLTKVIKNHKTGVYNVALQLILPVEFDEVELESGDYENDGTQVLDGFLRVFVNGKQGAYSLDGELIVPAIYDECTQFLWDYNCYMVSYYGLREDHEDKPSLYGIADESGHILLPLKFDEIDCFYIGEDSCSQQTPYAITRNNSYFTVRNLENQQHSREYKEIIPIHTSFVFKNNAGWGIMDKSFKTRISNLKHEPYYVSNKYISPVSEYKRHRRQNYGFALNITETLLIRETKAVKKIYTNNNQIYKEEVDFFGLFNIETGKSTPILYESILIKTDGKNHYYWCITFDDDDRTKGDVTVLDSNYEVLNHYSFQNGTYANWCYQDSRPEYLLIIKNTTGKLGVVDAAGSVILPFEYENAHSFTLFKNTDFEIKYWEIERDSLRLLISEVDKKIVLSNYYNIRECPNGNFLINTPNGQSLLTANFHPIVEGCEYIEYNEHKFTLKTNQIIPHSNGFRKQNNYDLLAIKQNKLYVIHQDTLTCVDTNFFYFEHPLMLFCHHYLTNVNGQIVRKGDVSSFTIGNRIVTVMTQNSQLTLLDSSWNVLFEISDCKSFKRTGSRLLIELDSTFGIVDLTTCRWLIEPIHARLKIIDNQLKTGIWASENRSGKIYWYPINEQNERLLDLEFDAPVWLNARQRYIIFRSHQQFGLIDHQFRCVLAPQQENIVQIEQLFFYKSNGKWGVFIDSNHQLKPQFTNFTLDNYPNAHVVFDRATVGILDDQLNWVKPMTDSTIALKNWDLAELLSIEKLKTDDYYDKSLLNDYHKSLQDHFNASSVSKKINNYILFAHLSSNAIKTQFRETLFITELFYKQSKVIQNREFINSIPDEELNTLILQFYSFPYVSLKKIQNRREWRDYSSDSEYKLKTAETYKNYQFIGDSLVSLELNGLFAENSNFKERLNELLTERINSSQMFGANCVNLELILAQFQQRFLLTKTGIRFFRENREITIPYSDLKTILQFPACFQHVK